MSKLTDTSVEIGKVYRTKDYSIFKGNIENRDINDPHAKKIYKKMKELGWISGSLVVVDEKGVIQEGHHRIACAIEAGVHIEYVIVSEPIKNLVSELNMNRKLWSIVDHMNTYVKRGHKDYIELQKFLRSYPEFTPSDAAMMCKNSTKSASRAEFESGGFKVADMELTRLWADQFREIKKYFPKGYSKGPFVRSFVRVLLKPDKFVFDEFMHKLKLRPDLLKEHQTIREYSAAIEEIYNYMRRDKVYLR